MSVSTTSSLCKALVALVPAMMALAPLSAQAATFTFNGGVPSGVDSLGGNYQAGPFGGGLVNFQEVAGLQNDPTQQVLFNPIGSGLANASSFTLTITGSTDKIIPLSSGFGNSFETFSADGHILSDWTATENAAHTSITYTADSAADVLTAGERFGTTTTFSKANTLPNDFAYTITWTGDAVSAAPEPASWAMMILGFGVTGATMRRRKANGQARIGTAFA